MRRFCPVALVTGGCSRGLGVRDCLVRASGERMAGCGQRSLPLIRRRSSTRSGQRAASLPGFIADVTDELAVVTLVAEVAERLGPIEALVAQRLRPAARRIGVAELTLRDHLDQLRFFVKSPTLLVQAVLPAHAGAPQRGRIINLGSDPVERAAPRLSSALPAAKSGAVRR